MRNSHTINYQYIENYLWELWRICLRFMIQIFKTLFWAKFSLISKYVIIFLEWRRRPAGRTNSTRFCFRFFTVFLVSLFSLKSNDGIVFWLKYNNDIVKYFFINKVIFPLRRYKLTFFTKNAPNFTKNTEITTLNIVIILKYSSNAFTIINLSWTLFLFRRLLLGVSLARCFAVIQCGSFFGTIVVRSARSRPITSLPEDTWNFTKFSSIMHL